MVRQDVKPTAVEPIRRDCNVGKVHRVVLLRASDGSFAAALMKDEYGEITWLEHEVPIERRDLAYLLQQEDGAIAFGNITIRLEHGNAYTVWGDELVGYVSRAALAADVRGFLEGHGSCEKPLKQRLGDMAYAPRNPRRSPYDWARITGRVGGES